MFQPDSLGLLYRLRIHVEDQKPDAIVLEHVTKLWIFGRKDVRASTGVEGSLQRSADAEMGHQVQGHL